MARGASLFNEGNLVHEAPPNSKEDIQQSAEHPSAVLHRSLNHNPLHVVGAEGNYLHLSNGQQIFDASGGAAVACLGHRNDRYSHKSLGFGKPNH